MSHQAAGPAPASGLPASGMPPQRPAQGPPQSPPQGSPPGGQQGAAPVVWNGPAGPVRPTNAKAVLAVSLLWVAPAAIIFGVLARKEIRRTGEAGWGLATWGLGLAIASVAIYVLYFVAIIGFYVVFVVGALAAGASGGFEGLFGTGSADPFGTGTGSF